MSDILDKQRIAIIRSYFRKVDERDDRLADLFTENVEFFFPKFGTAHGKAALARFGERIGRQMRSLEHDIDGLVFTVAGDRIAVEGQERGVTNDGLSWPDGTISDGRFCNMFEFDGSLVSRVFVYVDPDFTSADERLVRLLRDDVLTATPKEVAERYLERVSAFYADPDSPEKLAAVMALFSDTVDWNIAGNTARVPYIGPRHGKTEVAAFFTDLLRHVEPQRFEVRTVLASGENAVILGGLASLVKTTGKLIESEFAFDLTVRDGLIVRYRMLEDSYAVEQAY